MKHITSPLCRSGRAPERRAFRNIGLCLGCLLVVAVVLVLFDFLTGCATTPAGLSREQALYQASTNVVGNIRGVVPYLPPPAGAAAEAFLALATAALAAWNTHQHLAIKRLKNGNGNGAVAHPPAPDPPSHTRT